MLLNGIINGVSVPVEVSEEELRNNGYRSEMACFEDTEVLKSEGVRNIKIKFLDYLVRRMDITEEQQDWLAGSFAWDDFICDLLNLEDEEFVNRVMNGTMLVDMNAYAEEILPKEKLFEVSVNLRRTVVQEQTITVVVRAEDESEAEHKLLGIDYDDVESYAEECDWEEVDWDDYEIENWDIEGETEENENDYPIIELD